MDIKVLVVDDTDHVRTMLRDMLELDGFEVVGEAATGAHAVEMAPLLDPDVIVMDYKMPEMDGLTTAKSIRAARAGQPIILYTAYLDDGLEREAKEAGVALCIGKVEGLHQLERHIRQVAQSLAGQGQQTLEL